MVETATVSLGVSMVIFLSWYCQRLRRKCEEADQKLKKFEFSCSNQQLTIEGLNWRLKDMEVKVDNKNAELEHKDKEARELRQSIANMADRITGLEKIREKYGKLRIYSMEQCQLRDNLQSMCDQYEQTIQAQAGEILKLEKDLQQELAESEKKRAELADFLETVLGNQKDSTPEKQPSTTLLSHCYQCRRLTEWYIETRTGGIPTVQCVGCGEFMDASEVFQAIEISEEIG